jgi:hypothetical protein
MCPPYISVVLRLSTVVILLSPYILHLQLWFPLTSLWLTAKGYLAGKLSCVRCLSQTSTKRHFIPIRFKEIGRRITRAKETLTENLLCIYWSGKLVRIKAIEFYAFRD